MYFLGSAVQSQKCACQKNCQFVHRYKRCFLELLIHIPMNCCGFKVQTVITRNDSRKLKTIKQLASIAKLDWNVKTLC